MLHLADSLSVNMSLIISQEQSLHFPFFPSLAANFINTSRLRYTLVAEVCLSQSFFKYRGVCQPWVTRRRHLAKKMPWRFFFFYEQFDSDLCLIGRSDWEQGHLYRRSAEPFLEEKWQPSRLNDETLYL